MKDQKKIFQKLRAYSKNMPLHHHVSDADLQIQVSKLERHFASNLETAEERQLAQLRKVEHL